MRAWTIGKAVNPKRGQHSVGVHRRFVPAIDSQLANGLVLCRPSRASLSTGSCSGRGPGAARRPADSWPAARCGNRKVGLVRPVAGSPTSYRLPAEWSSVQQKVAGYWVTSLTDRRFGELLSPRHLDRTEAVVKELEDKFGILDLEGRSFPGWRRGILLDILLPLV